jgi:hypothetical protein
MEFYTDETIATKYFQDDSFVLRGERSQDPVTRKWTFEEVVLNLRFNFFGGDVSISAYDRVAQAYTYEFNSTSSKGLEKFLLKIEKDFNKTLPKSFYELPVEFLALSNQGFSVDVDLDNEPNWDYRHCEQCGDTSSNQLVAFYFPAINDKNPATFAVGWEYGCYGGTKVTFNEKEAYDLLQRAREDAESIALAKINKFVTKLEKVGITKSF